MSSADKQSWQLLKASAHVMLRNPKLLWFCVLSALLTALMILFFLAPLVLHPTGYHLNQKQHWVALSNHFLDADAAKPEAGHSAAASAALRQPASRTAATDASGARPVANHSLLVSLYLVALYFVSMFLTTFFNVAFYSEIIAAFNGRGVSFRRGLNVARSRLPSILAWTLLAGVVGWIIGKIEAWLPFAARIVTVLIGAAWSVAAVFVIPVMIQEPSVCNPMEILRKSALTLKRKWGEGLTGYAGFATGSLALALWVVVPIFMAAALGRFVNGIWLMVMAGFIWVLGLVFLACAYGLVGHVHLCALYVYATEGVAPEPYSQDLLDMAWKVKKS
jgi:hypothetical protein